MNAGVHPLKNEARPSFLYILDMIVREDIFRSDELAVIILVLITSTGEHTVVATRPYPKEEKSE
jgi:hypothetical protein